jgi:hypothetical protein
MQKNTTITVKLKGKHYTVQVTIKRKQSEAIKKRLKERHRIEVISQR